MRQKIWSSHWKNIVKRQNQTFLHRDAAGYFSFAHKRLAEFLVVYNLAAERGCLRKAFLVTYREEGCQICNIPYGRLDAEKLVNSFAAYVRWVRTRWEQQSSSLLRCWMGTRLSNFVKWLRTVGIGLRDKCTCSIIRQLFLLNTKFPWYLNWIRKGLRLRLA